jgi:hypothetical protein
MQRGDFVDFEIYRLGLFEGYDLTALFSFRGR